MSALLEKLNQIKTVQCQLYLGEITIVTSKNNLLELCKTLRDEEGFKFDLLLDVCAVDYLTYGVGEWATETATSQGFSRGVEEICSSSRLQNHVLDSNLDSDLTLSSSSRPSPHSGRSSRDPEIKPQQFTSRFAVVYHLLSTVLNQRVRIKVFLPLEDLNITSVTSIWPSANWFEREAYDLFGIFFNNHPDLRRILTDYGFVGHPFRKDFPLIGEVEMRYDAKLQRVIYEPVSIKDRTLVPKIVRFPSKPEVQNA